MCSLDGDSGQNFPWPQAIITVVFNAVDIESIFHDQVVL